MLELSFIFAEGARLCGKHWILQQDNAVIHTALKSKDFLQANNIRFFGSSTEFAGLNPIENLERWTARDVYKNGMRIETVGALRQAFFTSWRNIADNLM